MTNKLIKLSKALSRHIYNLVSAIAQLTSVNLDQEALRNADALSDAPYAVYYTRDK